MVSEDASQHDQQVPVGQHRYVGYAYFQQEGDGPRQCLLASSERVVLVLAGELSSSPVLFVELVTDLTLDVRTAPGEYCAEHCAVADPAKMETIIEVLGDPTNGQSSVS